MNNNPKISVIMSVYNTPELWLRQAIESILNQSYSNFEFIIITDCPNDNSIAILEEYKSNDNRIILKHNEKNMGLTYNLNFAVSIARGEYIARMDSDDISVKDRLLKQVLYMDKHESVVVVGSYACGFNDKSQDILIFDDFTQNSEYTKVRMLFCNSGIAHPTAFIRKSFLISKGINYDLKYLKAQDYGLWSDIVTENGIIKCINQVLLKYRISEKQISKRYYDQQVRFSKDIIKKQLIRLLNEVDDKDINLTYALTNFDFETSCDELIIFMNKMINANNLKKIYNPKMFNGEIKLLTSAFVLKRGLKSKKISLIIKSLKLINPYSLYLHYFKKYNHLKYKKAVKVFKA